MLAADESAPSNHNAHPAISRGSVTAVTGPASVVYRSEEDASSHRARPLMERGEKVPPGRRVRGEMGISTLDANGHGTCGPAYQDGRDERESETGIRDGKTSHRDGAGDRSAV
jgi:hypothetical protein